MSRAHDDTTDDTHRIEIDSRMFDGLEITAYKTADDTIEVRVIRDGFGKTECVAHLVEDGRRGVTEDTWYLPFRVEDLRSLEVTGVMDGEIGYIREIEETDVDHAENLTFDRLRATDDYPSHRVNNRMPEVSMKALKDGGDGFIGLKVLYGEEWLHGLRDYFERRADD